MGQATETIMGRKNKGNIHTYLQAMVGEGTARDDLFFATPGTIWSHGGGARLCVSSPSDTFEYRYI